MLRFGVIGVGRLGAAILRGVVKAGVFKSENILISDADTQKAKDLSVELDVRFQESNLKLLNSVDLCLLAVEPKDLMAVLAEAKSRKAPVPLASVAAGITLNKMETVLGAAYPIVRVMPNSPARVGAAMSSLCRNVAVSDEIFEQIKRVFGSIGEVLVAKEDSFDTITALAGSGPAFYYEILEGMIRGGVSGGLSEENARLLTAQTMLGAAKMVLDQNESPAKLREEVTTGGGCTEVGLEFLRQKSLQDILKNCVLKTSEKARQLGDG